MDLKIKEKNASKAKDYRYTIEEVAKYHGVSYNAVVSSRAYAKGKRDKKQRVEDKLDKLYAYHLATDGAKIEKVIEGDKESIIKELAVALSDEKHYKIKIED